MRTFSAFLLACALPLAAGAQERERGDSAGVAALLASVRGATPLLCELAARTVENHSGWWGGVGPTSLRQPRDPVARSGMLVVNGEKTPVAALPVLAAALSDPDACVRRIASPLLGRMNTPASHAALRTAMRDDNATTREAAAIALGYTDNGAAIPPLLAGIQDPVARVRAASAMSLGEIEDRRALGALVRLLREDRDEEVRAAAAWALGEIEG